MSPNKRPPADGAVPFKRRRFVTSTGSLPRQPLQRLDYNFPPANANNMCKPPASPPGIVNPYKLQASPPGIANPYKKDKSSSNLATAESHRSAPASSSRPGNECLTFLNDLSSGSESIIQIGTPKENPPRKYVDNDSDAGSHKPSVSDIDIVAGGAEERQLESTPPSEMIKCFQVFSSGWKCIDCKKPVPVGSSKSAVRKHIKAHHPSILLDGETCASVHRELLAASRRVSTLLASKPPSSGCARRVWRYKCLSCNHSFGRRNNFFRHGNNSSNRDCRRAYPVRTEYGVTPCGRFVEVSSATTEEMVPPEPLRNVVPEDEEVETRLRSGIIVEAPEHQPRNDIPTTSIKGTSIPTTSIKSTSIKSASIPTASIKSTSIPTTSMKSTSMPTTSMVNLRKGGVEETLKAVQVDITDKSAPLLPPDEYSNNPIVKTQFRRHDDMTADESRNIFQYLSCQAYAKDNDRKYVMGALYRNLIGDSYYIIDRRGARGLLNIDIKVGNTTSRLTIMDASGENALVKSVLDLGKALGPRGNSRVGVGDEGDMFGLGYRSKSERTVYKPTRDPRHPEIGRRMPVASLAAAGFLQRFFPDVWEDIVLSDRIGADGVPPLPEMGGVDGLGSFIAISRNLGNAAHDDFRDNSKSFGCWVEECPGRARNWYFILPNVWCCGRKGVVIKLFHGCAIIWDGKLIHHCSSIPCTGDDNNVYGCMFGSCRD